MGKLHLSLSTCPPSGVERVALGVRMNVGIESLFTSALGLVPPWQVGKVELETVRRRIDFEVRCSAKKLACPHCGAADQRIHDRLRRSWRHLDFFQVEARAWGTAADGDDAALPAGSTLSWSRQAASRWLGRASRQAAASKAGRIKSGETYRQ